MPKNAKGIARATRKRASALKKISKKFGEQKEQLQKLIDKNQKPTQTGSFKVDVSSVEKAKRAISSVSDGHTKRVMREGGPFRGLKNKVALIKRLAADKMGISKEALNKALDSGSKKMLILAPKVNPVNLRKRQAQKKKGS